MSSDEDADAQGETKPNVVNTQIQHVQFSNDEYTDENDISAI